MTAADVITGYRALALVICGSPGRPRRWATRAACAGQDPALFAQEATEADALAVCAGCPVLFECRADVLAFERSGYRWRKSPTGVVGGLTAEERRGIYRAEDRDKRQCSRTGQEALFSPADAALRAVQRRDVGVMRPEPVTVHRRILRPGETWLSIRGERGRFRYLGYSTSRAGDVSLCVCGGRPGRPADSEFPTGPGAHRAPEGGRAMSTQEIQDLMPLIVGGGVVAAVVWLLHKVGTALKNMWEAIATVLVAVVAIWFVIKVTCRLVRWCVVHWRTTLTAVGTGAWWFHLGWPSLAITAGVVVTSLLVWLLVDRDTFDPWAGRYLRSWWMRWTLYARKLPTWLHNCGLTIRDDESVSINMSPVRRAFAG